MLCWASGFAAKLVQKTLGFEKIDTNFRRQHRNCEAQHKIVRMGQGSACSAGLRGLGAKSSRSSRGHLGGQFQNCEAQAFFQIFWQNSEAQHNTYAILVWASRKWAQTLGDSTNIVEPKLIFNVFLCTVLGFCVLALFHRSLKKEYSMRLAGVTIFKKKKSSTLSPYIYDK